MMSSKQVELQCCSMYVFMKEGSTRSSSSELLWLFGLVVLHGFELYVERGFPKVLKAEAFV